MDFIRQRDLIDIKALQDMGITLIGAGAIGSFTALTLTKMGIKDIEIYDEDGVSTYNLPNQFYRNQDILAFKVNALGDILHQFSEVTIIPHQIFYTEEQLNTTVIVATDSMSSRKLVWEQFKKQEQCVNYIEARMGAQMGIIYTIRKPNDKIDKMVAMPDLYFYEETLYPDTQVKPLRCTERAIIYNILMISALICRAYKGIMQGEDIPREQIFNMQEMNKVSWMVR